MGWSAAAQEFLLGAGGGGHSCRVPRTSFTFSQDSLAIRLVFTAFVQNSNGLQREAVQGRNKGRDSPTACKLLSFGGNSI